MEKILPTPTPTKFFWGRVWLRLVVEAALGKPHSARPSAARDDAAQRPALPRVCSIAAKAARVSFNRNLRRRGIGVFSVSGFSGGGRPPWLLRQAARRVGDRRPLEHFIERR